MAVVVIVFAVLGGGGDDPVMTDGTAAVEEPATQEPATQEPATQEPATQEPATQEPVGDGFDPALEEELDGGLDPALDDDAAAEEEAGLRLMVSTAIDAFIVSESTCAAYAASVGNPPPDPRRFQGVGFEQVYDDGTVLIVDGLGTPLLVDMNGPAPTFSSFEGPQGTLPNDLSFGCPPELYLGTLPS